MRASTTAKLFPPDHPYAAAPYHTLWAIVDKKGIVNCVLLANHRVVIVHEYPDEKNGFAVYIPSTSNRVMHQRIEMGLIGNDPTFDHAGISRRAGDVHSFIFNHCATSFDSQRAILVAALEIVDQHIADREKGKGK